MRIASAVAQVHRLPSCVVSNIIMRTIILCCRLLKWMPRSASYWYWYFWVSDHQACCSLHRISVSDTIALITSLSIVSLVFAKLHLIFGNTVYKCPWHTFRWSDNLWGVVVTWSSGCYNVLMINTDQVSSPGLINSPTLLRPMQSFILAWIDKFRVSVSTVVMTGNCNNIVNKT